MYQAIEILESFTRDMISHSRLPGVVNIQDISCQIKRSLVSTVFDLKKDRLIELYIQNCQRRLVETSNNLYAAADNNSSEFSIVLAEIDNLLTYLFDDFKKFFNVNQVIPEKLKQESVTYFKEKNGVIETYNCENKDLILIALRPVFDFISGQSSSYQQLAYVHSLLDKLLQFVNEAHTSEYLKNQLLYLNFNSFSFLHYLTCDINFQLEELEDVPGKLTKLSWYLKWIKQIQIAEEPYHPGRSSIKELLSDWIKEEITFFEKCIQLNKVTAQELTTSGNQSFKLITDLSVPQLAYLIRIFIDSGLFKNTNHKAITKFFAQHTQTKNGGEISSTSLSNKLYEQDGNVEKVIKGLVINMLNQISKLR